MKTGVRNQSAALRRLARQGTDVLALAPMVASGRMMRLAAQRPTDAATSLGTLALEKMTTFGQAWWAMARVGVNAQYDLAMSMWSPWFKPHRGGSRLVDVAISMASSAMKPIHARVKSNTRKHKRLQS